MQDAKIQWQKEGDGEEIVFDQVTIYEIYNEIRKGE